jgi:glycosidase
MAGCQNSPSAQNDAAEKQAPSDTNQIESSTQMTKKAPEWTKNANIYEVNIRQYTPEGTLKAFTGHLDRLQDLGVEILWLMPVQPIGKERRKGSLGSYYSIADYAAINPEFGTLDDFKEMVSEAHKRGMKVILDWVANHTAWDHPWIYAHPEWYTQNEQGEIVAPVEDWSDVADLNYDNADMRRAMENDMLFWLEEADIDGFRCDMAMMVPMDFWNGVREKLDSVKPMFMLAEAEGPEFHHAAFDMSYGWELHHLMNDIAKGHKSVAEIDHYLQKQDSLYASQDYRMFFITNHDENSWNGTVQERMGANGLNFFVLAATLPQSMPLIYSGQEAGLNKALAFFEKDEIDWSDTTRYHFYRKMLQLKATHPCLVNGEAQGDFQKIDQQSDRAYAFKRQAGDHELIVAINLSDQKLSFQTNLNPEKAYQEVITGIKVDQGSLEIPANGYLVLSTMESLKE